MIALIAKAGIAAGFDGIFMETHPDVEHAKSDASNMLPLQDAENLLARLIKIRQAVI